MDRWLAVKMCQLLIYRMSYATYLYQCGWIFLFVYYDYECYHNDLEMWAVIS